MMEKREISFNVALMAGGIAGTSVDVILFPLDTIKTRLQSEQGFLRSGGFRGIYRGLFSAAVGSAPTAAVFFSTYEGTKYITKDLIGPSWAPVSHMTAAALGELAACVLRVPVEVVKQRAQATSSSSSSAAFRETIATEGFSGLYRGFLITIIREIPFSFIQFPLWEFFKKSWSRYQNEPIKAWQSSLCGACAGGIAAAVTTPLDVAKTRIMLAKRGSNVARGNVIVAWRHIVKENGIKGLFAGIAPRMTWISIGGAIFLGVYDKVCIEINEYTSRKNT